MEPALTTHDIRAPSIDICRRKTHQARWANGVVHADKLENCPDHAECWPYVNRALAEGCRRPQSQRSMSSLAAIKREDRRGTGRLDRQHRQAGRYEVEEEKNRADSVDDSARDEFTGPPPDAGVMYSFDAASGPQPGHQIFELALTKAVHSFERQQTDNLVRDEYEVVAPEPDVASPRPRRCRTSVIPSDDDLAEFDDESEDDDDNANKDKSNKGNNKNNKINKTNIGHAHTTTTATTTTTRKRAPCTNSSSSGDSSTPLCASSASTPTPTAPPPHHHPHPHHHDLASFLAHARRAGLSSASSVYHGTRYEYQVQAGLQRLGFQLARSGGRSDAGVDLFGTWRLPVPGPSPIAALRVLIQCKATRHKRPGPHLVRELEGAYAGAPGGPAWRDARAVVALLAAPRQATRGVRDALGRSPLPLAFVMVDTGGRVRQLVWNRAVRRLGLEDVGVALRYGEEPVGELVPALDGGGGGAEPVAGESGVLGIPEDSQPRREQQDRDQDQDQDRLRGEVILTWRGEVLSSE
ncbi:MAG: hypothetical protein M1826_006691 [Phylliscum demangeonii]|nr:MAG: hypothetical protein M1826_006691 [Phylliscum demangeonii]